MKALKLSIAILFSIFAINIVSAQTKTTDIKVWGNCEQCKSRIEKAAKSAGATKANWSDESLLLKVSYDTKKTNDQKIEQAIANAGYDTQDISAPDNAYKKLPGCCQYNRKSAAMNSVDSVIIKN